MRSLVVALLIFMLFGTAEAYKKCEDCPRDERGRIQRSQKAVKDFKRQNPCTATGKTTGACKGYVVDHIIPLACGGADVPGNMQWQTKAEAAEKDKIELKMC